jgi:hypothetical protein
MSLTTYKFVYKMEEITRQTRGWPLLHGDSLSTNERGLSLVGLLVLLCRYEIDHFCSALAALVGSVQNVFFLTIHYFKSFVPIRPASWAGSLAGTPVSWYASLEIRTEVFYAQEKRDRSRRIFCPCLAHS